MRTIGRSLSSLRNGALDDKRDGDKRFAPLANFLEAIPHICPHDLFRAEDAKAAHRKRIQHSPMSRASS